MWASAAWRPGGGAQIKIAPVLVVNDLEIFSDGCSMLEQLATSRAPDLLLLDLVLPGLSGIEICRHVRERFETMVVPIRPPRSLRRGYTLSVLRSRFASANMSTLVNT